MSKKRRKRLAKVEEHLAARQPPRKVSRGDLEAYQGSATTCTQCKNAFRDGDVLSVGTGVPTLVFHAGGCQKLWAVEKMQIYRGDWYVYKGITNRQAS